VRANVTVVEVDRPDRRARRANGKSDPLDAYAAARAALSGVASGIPKLRNGRVEAIRALRVVRRSAVKARTQAMNQLRALLLTGPAELREQLRQLRPTELVATCARLRPTADPADPEQASRPRCAGWPDVTSSSPRRSATPTATSRRWSTPPARGCSPCSASGSTSPDRLHSEAAFAHLCGVAPIPASSGRTHRHRLNRGGDRAANNALHTITLCRLRYDPRTHAYVAKRTKDGLSKKEIIRCLKRYIAREIYTALQPAPADVAAAEDLTAAA